MTSEKLQGEGNHDAALDYDKQATKFAKDRGKVQKAAEDAKRALEGPEKEALEAAEKRGKDRAHH